MKVETFFENFGQLTEAPNGMQKLRELILQLAVQGELTRTWRFVGVTSRKEGWGNCEFFDFCVLQRGFDLPLSNTDEGRFPVVTSAGIAAYHSEFKATAPGVVVGRSGSIGKVFYVEENFWPHNTALYVKDFRGNFPRYVYYYLLSFKAQQFSRSTAVPTLNRNNLRGLMVEVPPYEEQKQIVFRIEELMALCDELEARQQKRQTARVRLNNAALEGLLAARAPEEFAAHWQRICDNFDLLYDAPETVGRLREAVLQVAVQGKLLMHSGSESVTETPLGDLLRENSLNGISVRPNDSPPGVPILRISAGTSRRDGVVEEQDHKFIEIDDEILEQYKLIPGDLLACRFNGNLRFVGKFSLYVGYMGIDQVYPDKLIRFRVDEERCSAAYIRYAMNSTQVRERIEKMCATTAGNIGISAANLKTISISMPPLDVQNAIVEQIDQLMALCDELEAKLRQAQTASAKLATVTVRRLAEA